MKFAPELFPMGSFERQRTPGAYLDGIMAKNLDVFAKKINNDMTFMIIISGNDSVGNGKSTMKTQVATYLTWKINQLHGTNNTYTSANEFFTGRDLIKGSPKLPRLSVASLDEGDDLTTHGMKELAVRLKRYFRKCRQLNQIIILILPSFFELPKFFALARSHLLINVKFMGEYDRGRFDCYSPRAKKLLYIKGKKEWDYSAYPPSFSGSFASQYYFFPDRENEVKKYLNKKYQDMVDDAKEIEESKSTAQIEKELTIRLFNKVYCNIDITIKDLAKGFGVSDRTGDRYISIGKTSQENGEISEIRHPREYNNILVKGDENNGEDMESDSG